MTNLRYAWRSLAKSPGFVAVAILALGVGLGLSTTMFAVMDTLVNPHSPYRDAGSLFSIRPYFGRRTPMTSAELYRYLRDNTRSFEAVVPVAWRSNATTIQRDGGAPVQVFPMQVEPRWFTVTGVVPQIGRPFTASDGDNVIIVSLDMWRGLFGGRRSLDSARVTLGDRTMTIIGVMPRGFSAYQAWVPLPPGVDSTNSTASVVPYVRLRSGVTREQAEAELAGLAERLTQRFDARQSPFKFNLGQVVRQREELSDIHKAMVGSALAVLLIACVNLAHLMLTRGLAKRRELALRMALGASRGAVVRQMFTECLLITAGGAALGGLIAYWGADLLQNRMPTEITWVGLVRPVLSWRVFALGAGAAAASAILFGLVPAVRVAFALSLDEPMKDDAGTTTGRIRYRYNPLVIVEVALALVLMMGGGLLLRTVHTLREESAGINEDTLWRGFVYARRDSTSARPSRETILSVIRGTPGVRDVGAFSYIRSRGSAIIGEQTEDSTHTISMPLYMAVSPSYLGVMGLPILRGRGFLPGDGTGRAVAIVDALAAQRLYPGGEAVGRMVKLGSAASDGPWVPIVGVARSPMEREGDERYVPQPAIWVAMPDSVDGRMFAIRTASKDPAISATVAGRLQQLGTGAQIMAWDYAHRNEIISRTFLARVFVAMGSVALGLAALGLYGVLAYAVTRRMREFAVRVALGANPRMLLKMVLYDGFVMLLAGIGVGAFVALMASRMLDAVLISVLPSDVVSLVYCEIILITVGLAAAAGPALRASRADPMEILRAV